MVNKKKVYLERYADIFKALGHPVRLQIAVRLMSSECHVNKMVDKLGLPQSTVSQHLGILRNGGIITQRKEGVRTCYKVTDKTIRRIIKLLEV